MNKIALPRLGFLFGLKLLPLLGMERDDGIRGLGGLASSTSSSTISI